MKRYFSENKLMIAALAFDVLTIAAIIVFFIFDISAWIAVISGVIAVTLNISAKRKQKTNFNNHK